MATKIVFAPKMPDPIMDTARSMIPEGFEMVVTEHDHPDVLTHVAAAEYYIGFPRAGMGELCRSVRISPSTFMPPMLEGYFCMPAAAFQPR